MLFEPKTVHRTTGLTRPSGLMREFDQTGASGCESWIWLGDSQSLPHNLDAARTQRAVVWMIGELFSGSIAASTSTPRGLRLSTFVLDRDGIVSSPESVQPSAELVHRLRRQIESRLQEEPLEDGVTHSAEEIVAEALAGTAPQLVAFSQLVATPSNPEFSAALLRLAGRVGGMTGHSWRAGLVKNALGSDSLTLREAAVEAVEQWGDPELLPLLRAHTEPVAWLKGYIDAVIEDLSG